MKIISWNNCTGEENGGGSIKLIQGKDSREDYSSTFLRRLMIIGVKQGVVGQRGGNENLVNDERDFNDG